MIDYEALREAIITQAVRDWESLCNGEAETGRCNFKELIAFFLSDCNDLLYGMDLSGERILHKLMKTPGAPTWSEVRAMK